VRASVAAEKAGVRSVSIVSNGFLAQAKAIASSLGARDLAIAEYPGVIMTDGREVFRQKVEKLVGQIIEGAARTVKLSVKASEPEPGDIIFKGTLDEVHEYFIKNLWTDGLPIIPPTQEKVEQFMKFTARPPDEVIDVLLPENREATIWNIAVNGAMAGCRPEYMPVLIAIVEAIADPEFRVEDAGSTPGWEPLIVLNGPIIKDLEFNSGAGAMRVGRQANTSIGRFLRLYMRNVAGLRIPPGFTDKATIGTTFNVVMAENEDAIAELGWKPFSIDRGFKSGDNVITVQSVFCISPPIYTAGDRAKDHIQLITEVFGQATCGYWSHAGVVLQRWHPLILMSPSVARVIANDGWTKDDIRKYLYDNARIPAAQMENYSWQVGANKLDLCKLAAEGVIDKDYCQSTDPQRPVRVFLRADWIGIIVAGDPERNQSRGYVNNHKQGVPVSKKVILPANWTQLLKR
jgi:hypothetical protein